MATKSTLESLVTAQKAQIAQMQADMQALMARLDTQAPAPPKAAKPAKPLVSRGYFKALDNATGKWVDDTSRPCVIIAIPGAKERKCKPETFEQELALHAKLKSAYEALT